MTATGAPTDPLPGWVSRRFRSVGMSQFLIAVLTLSAGFLILYPIVMLLIGSVAPPGSNGTVSLDGYRQALSDPGAQSAAFTTIWLSLVRAVLATALAVFLAWALTRTDMPGRRLFHGLLLVSFFFPLLPQILAWTFLLAPRSGTLNVWIRTLIGSTAHSGPLDIYSYGGIIFVGVLGWSSFLYLFIAPAFRAVDASLEDAARMAGASGLRALRRISIPLLWPAILGAFGLAFVRMAESFETELLLGTPAGIYVFSTKIYEYLVNENTPQYGPAVAMSSLFVVLTFALILLQRRMLSGRSFQTIGGKDYRARPTQLGRWRYVLLAVLIVYNVIHLALPIGMLIVGSFQKTLARFAWDGFTLEHLKVLANPSVWRAVENTLIVGLVAASVAIAAVTVISYIVVRTRSRFRGALDVLTLVPYMVPSFVLGVGFLWAALNGIKLPFVLYGTLILMMVAFIVRLMPLGSRLMNGTMIQLSSELEEAARMAGASWLGSFRRIVLPLLWPALAIGWLMFMAVVIRDLSTIVLLYGPGTELLAVKFYAYWRTASLEDAAVLGMLMTVLGMLLASGVYVFGRSGSASAEQAIG